MLAKKKITFLMIGLLVFGMTIPLMSAKPQWINELSLVYWKTSDATEMDVEGDLTPGYKVYLDPSEDYFYLDIGTIDPVPDGEENEPEYYGFYLKTKPAGPFYKYWAGRDVTEEYAMENPESWQAHMWLIINGEEPMFYLKSDGDEATLIDGLTKDWEYSPYPGMDAPLRVNGEYPVGTYHFIGYPVVDGVPERTMIKIFFK
jgi:hypothetical protein